MKIEIGIAGTGRMGAAIAMRLAGLGHEVAVWNRTAARARALGLPVRETPQKLAAGSELIITSLADAAAVQAVYRSLLDVDVEGKLFIEMRACPPVARRALPARRAPRPRGRGRRHEARHQPAADGLLAGACRGLVTD